MSMIEPMLARYPGVKRVGGKKRHWRMAAHAVPFIIAVVLMAPLAIAGFISDLLIPFRMRLREARERRRAAKVERSAS